MLMVDLSHPAFQAHLGGKLQMTGRVNIETREDLARVYTPGFARVAAAIHRDPELIRRYTIRQNTVAIVTDGTAVSGIGDVGPYAALPVMEGKSLVFRRFAGINAVPICVDTRDSGEIVDTVARIAPAFGAVMLEDIAAPRCFEIEARLESVLGIPVLHDDQHATAISASAALLNALKRIGKRIGEIKVVMVGAGAAGTGCAKMFMQLGVTRLIACDRIGAIHRDRADLNPSKAWFAEHTNGACETGTLRDLLAGADVFLGVSGPGVVTADDIGSMAREPIVFALANPEPEILPSDLRGTRAIVATGRSDLPNQIDGGLAYPGLFRGVLDSHAPAFTDAMKLAAVHAIAGLVDADQLDAGRIIPDIFDERVMPAVAAAVAQAA
ncbi:malate dehydrogenase [Burkholderia singularis]|uniref:Malate dehydrogenase n=2 Tax=Burkholderia singularis TaxID=1503053 RepID=A0A103E258_9BURK|nr:NADP-dependent malic enzyme [Burkholderia sp. MSMB175]AOK28267.1 malate dehydrogenase [Burkholderia sp. Bp7605]KVE26656.1 malate dehydrogenase [Burkholderia singularis]